MWEPAGPERGAETICDELPVGVSATACKGNMGDEPEADVPGPGAAQNFGGTRGP